MTSCVLANALDYNFESYFSTQQKPFSYSTLDPTNQIFQLSDQTNQFDLRLNIKHQTKKTKTVGRLRFLGTSETEPYKENDLEREKSSVTSKWDLTDLFFEYRLNDKLYTVLGLQVYQWGGGELMNPSNPFFHFLADQRSAFFKEKGRILGRLHFDMNSNVSLIFMTEPVSNREPEFYYDDEFSQKYLVKLELLSDSQKNGIALSYGQERKKQNFLALTASYEFFEGFSAYIDGRATYKTRRLSPSRDADSGLIFFVEEELKGYSPIVLAGLRFETESYDMRIEYFYNERGFYKDELTDIRQSFVTPVGLLNLQSYLRSGLELPGQRYIYTSVRRTRLGKDEDQSLSLRYINSIQDNSGAFLATYEAPFKDAWTLFLETNVIAGQALGELSFIKQNKYMLGLSYFF